MSQLWIVVGDTTSGGGNVVTGSPFTDIDGKSVARIGDNVICGRHGATVIATGDPTIIIDGQAVARHGDACACGCMLVSAQQMHVFVDSGGAAGTRVGSATSAAIAAAATQAAAGLAKAAAAASTGKYDEQLRFVNANGARLADVGYLLHLADGSQVEGTTDSDGRTGRISTKTPQQIVRAELTPADIVCCPLHASLVQQSVAAFQMPIASVATNTNNVGQSLQQVATPKGESRGLTSGEIDMARLVFGDSIDYVRVKVHNGEYLWFGMQPNDTAMTPNGEMYFNPQYFSEDFSSSSRVDNQRWFIHEMTHVWQHQLGYPVKWRGAIRIALGYDYSLQPGLRLRDFNMEQQGNIIADYYLVRFRKRPDMMYEGKYVADPAVTVLFEDVLDDFLRDPKDPINLP